MPFLVAAVAGPASARAASGAAVSASVRATRGELGICAIYPR
jgi:hypothetical protein